VRTRLTILGLAASISLGACGSEGVSTREVERAAIERARQELSLRVDVPLKATVWTGRESDGQLTYCGSVSSEDGASAPIRPRQFAASGDPPTLFIFGDAHQTDPRSQPGKFENWTALCAGAQDA
jgi:hypothetical protein